MLGAERQHFKTMYGFSMITPRPVRSRRGLHPNLQGQRGPNALRPLPEARKRPQANRRQPVQMGRVPLVESGRQCPARRQTQPRKHALVRHSRMKGFSRCSRLTKNMKRTRSAISNIELQCYRVFSFCDSRQSSREAFGQMAHKEKRL